VAGAFKLAVGSGIVAVSPLTLAPRPKAQRSIPKHWSPEQAREFLALMEGDRTYPVWAFLLGSGLRIGELVWLRWSNVDLRAGVVRVVEFATAWATTWSPRTARAATPCEQSTSTPAS
jgi:integrase